MLYRLPSEVGGFVLFFVLCIILSTSPAFTVANSTILTFESVISFRAKVALFIFLACFSNLQFGHLVVVELLGVGGRKIGS
jgi:hypothetical protein